jgi:hypothetical protein
MSNRDDRSVREKPGEVMLARDHPARLQNEIRQHVPGHEEREESRGFRGH